mgnify:CR=1 FL=1
MATNQKLSEALKGNTNAAKNHVKKAIAGVSAAASSAGTKISGALSSASDKAGAKISGALSAAGDKAVSAALTGRRMYNDRATIAKGAKAGAKIGGAIGAAKGAVKSGIAGARAGKQASDKLQSAKAKLSNSPLAGTRLGKAVGVNKPDNSVKGRVKAAAGNIKQDAKYALSGAKAAAKVGSATGRATGTVTGAVKGAKAGNAVAMGVRRAKGEVAALKTRVNSAIKSKKASN